MNNSRQEKKMIRLSSVTFKGEKITDWLAYFQYNEKHLLKLDFALSEKISKEEIRMIAPSVQAFQKGEGSDGSHLLKTVEDYANKTGDIRYVKEMVYFVREENRHSATLKKFMDVYQIKPAVTCGLDGIFRMLRKSSGLKGEILVLVTAEMIALSYYTALSKAVSSELLGQICRQMLRDELRHVLFQSERLGKIGLTEKDRHLRKLLMAASANAVWLKFGKVFERGGYSKTAYMSECMGYLKQSDRIAEEMQEKQEVQT